MHQVKMPRLLSTSAQIINISIFHLLKTINLDFILKPTMYLKTSQPCKMQEDFHKKVSLFLKSPHSPTFNPLKPWGQPLKEGAHHFPFNCQVF